MATLNEKMTHWEHPDDGGKLPTNFRIILGEGFEIRQNGEEEKTVWLNDDADEAFLSMEVPYTSGSVQMGIEAFYTNDTGQPGQKRSPVLANWNMRPHRKRGMTQVQGFSTELIDEADPPERAGFILWPDTMRFWLDKAFTPRYEGDGDQLLPHRVDMVIVDDDDVEIVIDWIRLNPREEDEEPPHLDYVGVQSEQVQMEEQPIKSDFI